MFSFFLGCVNRKVPTSIQPMEDSDQVRAGLTIALCIAQCEASVQQERGRCYDEEPV